MRVGISAEFLGIKRGGTATYTRNLLQGLASLDTEHDFHPYLAARTARPLVPVARHIAPRVVAPYSAAVRLTATLPAELLVRPVDLLHAQGWGPPWSPCPVVLTVHDLSWEVQPEVYATALRWRLRWLVRASVRRARRIIASSEHTAADLRRLYGCPAAKIRVIPCAVDAGWRQVDEPTALARVRQRYGIRGPYVLYVGGIEPRKGVDRLIHAFAALRRLRDLPHQLVICGTPQWGAGPILALPAVLGLGEAVVFAGAVPDADLAPLYSGATLFAFLGLYEGFGLPPIEAMACGAPVLAADRAALAEVVGEAGLLVDPFDEGAVVRGLERLLEDAPLRESLRLRGQRRAAGFQPAPVARRVVDVYEECWAAGRRKGVPA
jgi:glycosyltransferase involved in cell wall biosynthesis